MLNKVMIIGNLGKEPEIRSTQDGREIANLTVATNESWTDKNSGQKKERVEFHRVSVFSPGLVKVVKAYLSKGSKVFIEGQLQTRKWQDNSGQDRYSTEIVLQGFNGNLIMLSGKKQDTAQDYNNASGGSAYVADELDDSLPF